MTSDAQNFAAGWESISTEYKGFPLYLRRPVNLNFDSLKSKYPILLTLKHKFSFREFDGMPVSTYNKVLEEFDVSVTRYFSADSNGQIILVETFGGERNYYFYVVETVDSEAVLRVLRSRFPGYLLEIHSKRDAEWNFVHRYAEEFAIGA